MLHALTTCLQPLPKPVPTCKPSCVAAKAYNFAAHHDNRHAAYIHTHRPSVRGDHPPSCLMSLKHHVVIIITRHTLSSALHCHSLASAHSGQQRWKPKPKSYALPLVGIEPGCMRVTGGDDAAGGGCHAGRSSQCSSCCREPAGSCVGGGALGPRQRLAGCPPGSDGLGPSGVLNDLYCNVVFFAFDGR